MKNEKFGIKYFYTGLTAFLVIAACVVFFFLMYRLPGIFAFLKKLLGVIVWPLRAILKVNWAI